MNSFKDISKVTEEKLCNSCGACFTICPSKAIEFKETIAGYLFAEIDKNKCSNCGLCVEVCPGITFNRNLLNKIPDDPFTGSIIESYIGKAVDKKIYENSQSGGVVTALLSNLFDSKDIDGAIVVSGCSGEPPRAKAFLATSKQELYLSQKSKYCPVPLLKIIDQVKDSDKHVAIVGLSCQIHGLINLFDKIPSLKERIKYKIGLVCDRVLSNAAVDFMCKKASDSKADGFVFRDKNKPAYPGNPVVKTIDQNEIILNSSLRMAIKDFFTPPRCRLCFDKLNIFSDITVADPHGLKFDKINGESLIFVRNNEGQELISSAVKENVIEIRKTDTEKAIQGQGIDQKRRQWHNYSNAWLKLKNELPNYYQTVSRTSTKTGPSISCKKELIQKFNLDNLSNRCKVISVAKRWLKKRRRMNTIKWPLKQIKKLIN